MRSLFRFALAAAAVSVSVVAANAAPVNYTGTASLTDTKGAIVSSTFDPVNFTAPPYTAGPFDYSVVMNPVNDDELTLSVTFTAPGTGSGDITGDANVSTGYFFGKYTDGTITWDSSSSDDITLSNGSIVELYLPSDWRGDPDSINLSTCRNNSSEACGSGSFTVGIETNDPASAATPEPSSLILLGTGLLGSVGVLRRRFSL